MSPLRMIYLGLTVLGVIMPMRYFIPWILEHGLSLHTILNAWHVNAATSGLVWDLTISAAALVVWIVAEVYVRKDYWVALICIPVTFCIGVSAGFPLYLFLRTRPIK